MSKKTTKALASATLMSLVLTTALTAGPVKAAAGSVTRTGGADRYETAAKVATTNWTSAENVILVNGLSYADSVSASVLAKKLNAPILLTEADSLNSNAKSALEKLSPKNVYIVGGTGAVSQSVESSLSDYEVTRLAGTNRYDTNLAVANKLVDLGVSKDNMLAVTGQAYSDALSAAPVAAAKDQILLLTTNDKTSMKATDEFAKDANVTVIGTTNSVDADTYSNLAADKRIDGGKDRFATNINILKAFDSDLKDDALYAATGKANADGVKDTAFADALVASAIAGKNSAPLVLLDSDSSDATSNALNYIGTKATKSTDLQVVGGTGVVSDSLVSKINDKVNPKGDDNAEVSSIEANGLNQIKVVFSGKVDSDTAEDLSNYEVDGTSLNETATYPDGSVKAKLQDDDKTVLITLADKEDQNKDVDVKVKKGVLTEDKSSTVPELTQTVTFSDTTAPTLESVEARGNKKLVVKFSEPVNVGSNENGSGVYSKFKINGKGITSLGLDTDNTKAKDAVKSTSSDGDFWTNELDFYFTSSLDTGDSTLKISDGTDGALEDAAGFPISEVSQGFTVDTLTSSPKINSITANDDGKVYINFDRPMDQKTATEADNYKINGYELSKGTNCSDIELKKDDTQVKISGITGNAKLNKNSNKLYVDDNVKDAYGNYVEDDTYEAFNLDEDTTKPTVSEVYALNDNTIRVRFSKPVDASYARNVSNYKLRDASGNDITNEIDKDNIVIPGGSSDDTTADVIDIPLSGTYKLSDSKYTITIKNIQDMASTPNVMDDYDQTFNGSDDVNGGVKVYKVSDTKITLVFDKEMDSSTLDDIDNYKYINGKNDPAKTFPSKTHISVSSDNKSVTIDLSDTSLTTENENLSNKVTAVYATGIKDNNGNSLDVGNNGGTVPSDTIGSAKAKDNSLKLRYEGKDLKADINFENPVDADTIKTNSKADFTLGNSDDTVKIEADSVVVNKNGGLTLTFNRDSNDATSFKTKINSIKDLGNGAILKIAPDTSVEDVTGASLVGQTVSGTNITPYFYDAAPKTVFTNNTTGETDKAWTAKKTVDADGNVTSAEVAVKFDMPVANARSGDFKFSVGGTTIEADDVETDGNTVTFKFDSDNKNIESFKAATVVVTPKNTLGDSLKDISTVKDGNGDYTYYVPSDDDLQGRTVNITVEP